jgi:Uri superfamily endonuclease
LKRKENDLLIELESEKKIEIGKLENTNFKKGFYAYVGSTEKNLIQRVEGHYSREKKWHIDYLLESSEIIESYLSSKAECEIAGELSENFSAIKGFGSSDCRCPSHLFYSSNLEDFRDRLRIIGFEKFRERADYHNKEP